MKTCCLRASGLVNRMGVKGFWRSSAPAGAARTRCEIPLFSPFNNLPIASVKSQTALFVRRCEQSRRKAAAQAKLWGSDFFPERPALFVIQRVESDLLFIVEQVQSIHSTIIISYKTMSKVQSSNRSAVCAVRTLAKYACSNIFFNTKPMSVTHKKRSRPSLGHTNPGGGSAFVVVRSVRALYEALTRPSLPDFAHNINNRNKTHE